MSVAFAQITIFATKFDNTVPLVVNETLPQVDHHRESVSHIKIKSLARYTGLASVAVTSLQLYIVMLRMDKRLCWTMFFGIFIFALIKYNFNSQITQENTRIQEIATFKEVIVREDLSNETTVVTAYWNLGRFLKGGGSTYFDTQLYKKWANAFRYIYNPVVVYTDSEEFAELMKAIRTVKDHRTTIFVVKRNSSWAFMNVGRIKAIYSLPKYPKHHPNTVVPEYSCAQLAKYDVTARAVRHNIYKTKFFAWLDIGYFRDRSSKKGFYLTTPDKFNENMIAMNQVYLRQDLSPSRIFRGNIVWVGGGLFFGRYDVILRHEEQIKKAVDYFIDKQLMNTDQQLLYAMYSKEGLEHLKPETSLQTYWSKGDWFYLGKSMVRELVSVDTVVPSS